MENFWTSKKPKIGLRHFVLINSIKKKEPKIFLLVSVIDCEIHLKVTYEELLNSGDWEKGWLNLPKNESITEEYKNYKSSSKMEGIDEIFFDDDSIFNIS